MESSSPEDTIEKKQAVDKIFIGAIIMGVCMGAITCLMSKFFDIASIDPWPQLIVIPACYVPPFIAGTLVGTFLVIKGIKSINVTNSD